jgi:glucose-1-phosphate thymidylyltransferase
MNRRGGIMIQKGIVLAGGSGTRLFPMTVAVSKQLLPVYDKPLVYYPLATLMLSGIRRILLISTAQDLPCFERVFGDGRLLGLSIQYAIQPEPRGIAEAILIGASFIDGDPVALVLGDNIIYGHNLRQVLLWAARQTDGATIFGYPVKNPCRYGVVELDQEGQAVSIEEKPRVPKSHYAVPGLYFYDSHAVELAEALEVSSRGELEITDLHRAYLARGRLRVRLLGRGFAWLDAGTPEALLQAASFVEAIEQRQGLKIGCPEEIAYRLGYVGRAELRALIESCHGTYRDYLQSLDGEGHSHA